MNNEMPLLRRWGLALLTASVPLLVMLIILIGQGYQWGNYAPAMGDEINYWHQATTWARAGINGGYYVIDDTPARASFAHYYSWGFGPPIVYGAFATLFGWPLTGAMAVNALFVFASVVGFVLLTRLNPRQCLWLALLLAVYPPLIAYMPSSMLEPIYMSMTLLIAGCFYRLVMGEQDLWLLVLTGVLLIFMGFMRFTWAFLFWPYLYYLPTWRVWTWRRHMSSSGPSPNQGRRAVLAFFITVVLVGIFFVIYNFTSSPYVYALTLMIGMIPTEPVMAFLYYINMVAENVLWFLIPVHPPSIMLRFVSVGMLIWVIVRRRRTRTRLQRDSLTLLLYLLGGAFVLAFFIYTTMHSVGFRFFASYVLMTLALCIAFDRMGVVRVVVALFALSLPLAFVGSDTMRDRAFAPGRAEQVAAYQDEWQSLDVVYTEGADPWCNTFAHSIRYLEDLVNQDRLLALEPGMGISIIWWKPEQPQRAQFLMLTDEDYEIYEQPTQLIHLLDVPGGAVYRNTARECPQP